ncbi:hypothetical protein B0F90DRAFT_1919638 [Multifurca ochricompacta]|uniref:Uncharacterized protein n=1 Tax=Multifurca ochricompacta TaxID=376703 RepID=A0AAD4QKL3_9AGAM|nr:hypothetical protein B0F90DRAFT_1919638 [Multifurca ochricompacta]
MTTLPGQGVVRGPRGVWERKRASALDVGFLASCFPATHGSPKYTPTVLKGPHIPGHSSPIQEGGADARVRIYREVGGCQCPDVKRGVQGPSATEKGCSFTRSTYRTSAVLKLVWRLSFVFCWEKGVFFSGVAHAQESYSALTYFVKTKKRLGDIDKQNRNNLLPSLLNQLPNQSDHRFNILSFFTWPTPVALGNLLWVLPALDPSRPGIGIKNVLESLMSFPLSLQDESGQKKVNMRRWREKDRRAVIKKLVPTSRFKKQITSVGFG